VVIVENAHEADVASMRFLDAALRNVEDRPLFVVAFGRPEIGDRFPALWVERGVRRIELAPLSRTASESIVHHALGRNAPPEVVARLVDHAAGNAFFLEELCRAKAAGGEDLPESVLAMVEARLERLDPEARRVLRAASIFGRTFSRSGVLALLGA